MKRFSPAKFTITLGLCIAAWAAVAALCMMVGSSGTFGWPDSATLPFRRDPVLLASLVGAALAAAGVTYQALLGNPLADPYLLGTSSGAMLASFIWTLPAFTSIAVGFALGQQIMAFVGALIAVALVLGIAGRRGRLEPVTLILVGVIVNAVCGSTFLLINSLVKDPARRGGAIDFLVGGLNSNLRPWELFTSAVMFGGGWILLSLIAGALNAGSMDETEATSLGVRVNRLRWIGLIIASLLTATAVAVSGPIGFVGLICPHVARLIVGGDARRLLPVATALGAILLCAADATARKLQSVGPIGTYLPVGVLTSMLGGPFFLLLLLRKRS